MKFSPDYIKASSEILKMDRFIEEDKFEENDIENSLYSNTVREDFILENIEIKN